MNPVARLFAALRMLQLYLRSAIFRLYLRLAYPGVHCHRSVIFCKGVIVRAFDGARIEIGEGTVLLEYSYVQAEGGNLSIGRACLLGRGSVVVCSDAISIGDGTLIAEHVTIRDQDHNHRGEGRLVSQGSCTAPVRIGHDVWLGAKVTVTKGVEIAPHAVIGANAVVTRSLLERGIYAGAPARLVRAAEPGPIEG